jgi:Cu/Ag efflux protein CusF
MQVYQVVVLVNLALAVGGLAGYLWRQAEVDALRRALNDERLAVVRREGQPHQWTVSGIVRGTVPDRGALMLTHEPIRPLMGAMTMAFPVADRHLLEAGRVGDLVRFTVVTRGRDLVIVAVERQDGEGTTSTGRSRR